MAVPVSSVCELTRKRDDERNCCSLYRAVEDNTGLRYRIIEKEAATSCLGVKMWLRFLLPFRGRAGIL